jgi:4-hydroxy-3-methylbut-2-enyl diphosphate reductase IspH
VVLIAGEKHSAAGPVSVSQAPESVLPVRKLADVLDPRESWIAPDRLSVVVQTGMPVEEATAMLSVLRARFPLVRGQHYDALCYAATDRAAAIKQVAAVSDLVLVLGDAADPDAMHMQAEAAAAAAGPGQPNAVVAGPGRSDAVAAGRGQPNAVVAGSGRSDAVVAGRGRSDAVVAGPGQSGTGRSAVYTIAAVGDIEADWLTSVDTVGVVLSRSARPGLIAEVCEALSGLGPLTVVNRRVRTSPGQTQTPVPEPAPA